MGQRIFYGGSADVRSIKTVLAHLLLNILACKRQSFFIERRAEAELRIAENDRSRRRILKLAGRSHMPNETPGACDESQRNPVSARFGVNLNVLQVTRIDGLLSGLVLDCNDKFAGEIQFARAQGSSDENSKGEKPKGGR